MKNTGRCPKCQSRALVHVPGRVRANRLGSTNIYLGLFSAAPLALYLCSECGYTEQWLESKGDIAKVAKKFGK